MPTRSYFLDYINISNFSIVFSCLGNHKLWLMSESTREAKDPEILIQEVWAGAPELTFQELPRDVVGGDDDGSDGNDDDGGDDDVMAVIVVMAIMMMKKMTIVIAVMVVIMVMVMMIMMVMIRVIMTATYSC